MKSKVKPKNLPVLYLFATVIVMVVAHRFLPMAQLLASPLNHVGAAILGAGVVMTGVSAGSFVRAGTPLLPFSRSTAMVTTGLYRYTRNPMYLGMVVALSGVGFWLGSVASLIPVPVFGWFIDRRFIRLEEKYLEELFGDEYLAYKKQARRWI